MLVQESIGCGPGSPPGVKLVGFGETVMTDEQLSNIANLIGGNMASVTDMAVAFDSMSKSDAKRLKLALLASGAPGSFVDMAYSHSKHGGIMGGKYATVWAVLGTASMAASAYHGWKRTGSWGWTLGWAFMGGLFPVFTPVVALAQGFGKPKR